MKIDRDQTRHGLVLGRTGAGKSVELERVGELYYDAGYKVVDLWAGRKGENQYPCLPGKLPPWTNEDIEIDPSGVNTTILHPLTNKLPEKLPEPYRPFTIPLDTLDESDLHAIIGDLSKNERHLFRAGLEYIDSTSGIAEFLSNLREIPKRRTIKDSETGLALRSPNRHQLSDLLWSFQPLLKHKVISSRRSPLSLDLKEELNRDTWTSLSSKFTPSLSFALFVATWLLRNTYELARENKLDKPVVVLIREFGQLLPERTTDVKRQVIRKQLERVLKMGRASSVGVWGDAQRPSQISNLSRSQMSYVITTRITSTKDIEALMTPSLKNKLTEEDLEAISELRNHRYYAFTPSGIIRKDGKGMRGLPPRFRHKEEGESFFTVWAEEGPDEWIDWSDEYESVENEVESQVEIYNQRLLKEIEEEEKEEQEKKSNKEQVPIELLRKGRFKREDVEEALDVCESTARTYLKSWREKDVVDKSREGRAVYYTLKNVGDSRNP